MCTAISDNKLFGRTLDLEYSYDEKVVIMPRKYQISFIYEGKFSDHFAMIGTAHVVDGIQLYYDAINEKGLCAAALRFPKIAVYHEKMPNKLNLASFELIPWLLCNCANVSEAKSALKNANLCPDSFSQELAATPLHWMISDGEQSIVIESVKEGLKIYENPYGVLTNAPCFPRQCQSLSESFTISRSSRISNEKSVDIPGDTSSSSRFIRVFYAKKHAEPPIDKSDAISRFFHIMGTVDLPSGLARADDNRPMRTVYTSCMDTESLTYYFTTYSCPQIRAVRMTDVEICKDKPTVYLMTSPGGISYLN